MCKAGCWGQTDPRLDLQLCPSSFCDLDLWLSLPEPLFSLLKLVTLHLSFIDLGGWDVKNNRYRTLNPMPGMVNMFSSQMCKSPMHQWALSLEHTRLGADYLSLPHACVYLSTHLSIYLPTIHPSIPPSSLLPICPPIHPSIHASIIHPSPIHPSFIFIPPVNLYFHPPTHPWLNSKY